LVTSWFYWTQVGCINCIEQKNGVLSRCHTVPLSEVAYSLMLCFEKLIKWSFHLYKYLVLLNWIVWILKPAITRQDKRFWCFRWLTPIWLIFCQYIHFMLQYVPDIYTVCLHGRYCLKSV
jgi:hypothetical protein